jgi:hypothetical protein
MSAILRSLPAPTGLSITIEVRSVYGALQSYPVCEKADTFAAIAGTKTLTRAALHHIEALGYRIVNRAPAYCWRDAR